MKWTVMKNVKNLKYTTVDWVRKVSVTKDLTVRERNVNKKLWEELKEKRSHGEEGWYIRNEKLVRSRRGQEQDKSQSKEEIVRIKLINIQGLTKAKYVEVEQLVENELDIICLTETQLKYDKFEMLKGIKKIESHRESNDRKMWWVNGTLW